MKSEQKINNIATAAVCEIWDERKLLREKATPKKIHRRQTVLEQAKSFADQGKLPGYANTGTMTYTEFLTLPKPHQRNKIKKVL